MAFQPSEEQLYYLSQNMSDLELIGEFTAYPTVKVEPCEEPFESFIEMNQCYMNAFRIMAELYTRNKHADARYVCGVTWGYNVPICHAWIKLDGVHYDPTLEKSQKAFYGERFNGYFPVAELTMEQLFAITIDNECTPPHPALIVTEYPELLLPTKEGFKL